MPHKFRKHVWIKRGDYVVTEPIPEGNKVRAEIVRILMKDHIRYIVQNNKWPAGFSEHEDEEKDEKEASKELERIKLKDDVESDEESGDDDDDDDDLLMENPNRPVVYVEETDSSEDESEEDKTSGSEEESE